MRPKTPGKGALIRQQDKELQLSSEDEAALDLFCESFEFDDMSFGDWSQSLKDLNILIDHAISLEEAKTGGKTQIQIVRRVFNSKTKSFHRQPTSIQLEWPAQINNGHVLTLPKQGDFGEKTKGDLKVRFKVKM